MGQGKEVCIRSTAAVMPGDLGGEPVKNSPPKYFLNIWTLVEPSAGGGGHVTCTLSTGRLLSSLYEDLPRMLSLGYALKRGSRAKGSKYTP